MYVLSTSTGRAPPTSWSQSPRFVTLHGAHDGMSGKEAAALEGKHVGPGCGLNRYIHLRWNAETIFVLTVTKGVVSGMTYLGPHSVTPRGLC